ncbi:hypothetical protein BKA59DRAFT_496841 [Fusarium tricinctum]|uniref:Secreted LysM effector LysM C-terminal domain-containing protein n=1 Tax=Fusarium tricinctum TaxID=61284 RepID=A0A8K0RKF8_9HYPO|nr:hypothetical protein BKA59DRAFT_496841 [Fusarium tricinctum]
MYISASTYLAILSVALAPVSAWQATFYSDSICSPKDNTQYRIISGEVDGGCKVFGQDMPDTTCAKYTQGGVTKGGCDGEEFTIWSILVEPNTACIVYMDDHCETGSRLVMPRNNQPTCEAYSAGIGFGTDSIKSFQCTSASKVNG